MRARPAARRLSVVPLARALTFDTVWRTFRGVPRQVRRTSGAYGVVLASCAFQAREDPMKPAVEKMLADVKAGKDRRSFFKTLGLTAAGAMALTGEAGADAAASLVQANVNRASEPSALKITDLRVAVLTGVPFTCPLIRIDTNQGLVGWGEVRDGSNEVYALMLKSRILGENPCNVDRIFRKIKQFGHHARQAGGVCSIEVALMDLAGKAWGVPCWQLLGGKFRDRVRLYADTTVTSDPKEQGRRLRERMDRGITYLKQDFGIGLLQKIPGTLSMPAGTNIGQGQTVMHPFTGIEITDKGIAWLSDWVGQIREIIGMDIPLSTDHYGHISVNSCIKLARAMERWNLAWMEDMVPWQFGELMKQIKDSTTVPILTGEDIYLKEDFIKLIDMGAVDMIHPDLASSGGLIETKKIGDYAMEHGVAMAMHFAGTPVNFMASVHCAAATENFIALEHHSMDVPWWESIVRTTGGNALVEKGFAVVPNSPGLGVDLNEEVVKQHLRPKSEYFAPTPEWNEFRANDRLWS
jgi:L-alanine-DL-glutamate epimerase-like enolase superfamily enzyme